MSYTVFALKWRPNNFNAIVGQEHIVTTLKNAIEKNRLAHAYLFAGPRGIGKTSTARILAKALNCKNGPTITPCEKCPSCIEIAQSRSFDVIEIDGASNRGIDEIRVLRENVKFSPVSGKFKIYIIDEVHMLTSEAFNALLKTLEEPPDFVKFIFATTQANKVLPTILSRCQRFDFRRITVMEIIFQLERIVAQEEIDIDKEVLSAIARSSDGALRDAESLLDQLSSFSKGRISVKDVVSILGIVEQEALFELTDKIIRKDARNALALLNKIIDEGKDAGLFLISLIEHFRNLMITKVTKADSKLIDLPQEICDRLLQQSQYFTLEEIFASFNNLLNAQEMAKRLESTRIPLEIILIKLAYEKKVTNLSPHPPVSAAAPVSASKAAREIRTHKEIKQPETSPEFEPEPDSQPENQNKGSVNTATLDNVKDVWKDIIAALGKVKMSAATYLNEGDSVKLENNILTISFPRDYSLHKESLETKENRAVIEKTISDILHADVKVNFVLSKETARKEGNINEPFVKSALDTFKARVIKEG